MACASDLLVIGGGPAGLAAAINGASEGLIVRMLDAGVSLGGQARESSAIENYPGFPDGVTGDELMSCFVRQAHKFSATMLCPLAAARINRDGEHIIVTTDDYQEFVTRAVLISIGLSYRRLNASGLGQLMGRGIFYGMPPARVQVTKACNVAVVGGANSAGQAVTKLASNPRVKVKMFVRKTLDAQMSTYLVDRIRSLPNVEVFEHSEVTAAHGRRALESITVRNNGVDEELAMDYLFIFIGAVPKTMWLQESLQLDEGRYIRTWTDVVYEIDQGPVRSALPYETSMPGVFAAGDVRAGSTKRIATAIGEGAGALQMIHGYFGL